MDVRLPTRRLEATGAALCCPHSFCHYTVDCSFAGAPHAKGAVCMSSAVPFCCAVLCCAGATASYSRVLTHLHHTLLPCTFNRSSTTLCHVRIGICMPHARAGASAQRHVRHPSGQASRTQAAVHTAGGESDESCGTYFGFRYH